MLVDKTPTDSNEMNTMLIKISDNWIMIESRNIQHGILM